MSEKDRTIPLRAQPLAVAYDRARKDSLTRSSPLPLAVDVLKRAADVENAKALMQAIAAARLDTVVRRI
jgi:hypothetical protein